MQTYKHVNKIILGALVVTGAFLVCVVANTADKSARYTENASKVSIVHPGTVMQGDLYTSLENFDVVTPESEKVYGTIVSHHFYMEPYMGKLFLELRNQKPSVVVVVGPNHFGVGRSDIQVSKAEFNTPFGKLSPATALANQLIVSKSLAVEEVAFEREHAIGALTGFIKKIWPDTTILPIIVKRGASQARAEELASELSKILPSDSLVVASVDFSHHMDRFAASFHDSQSVSALLGGDVARIMRSEVDSPQSLVVLTEYLRSRGALNMLYTNTNQARVSGNLLSDDVTSYVFAKFIKGVLQPNDASTFMHYGMFEQKTFDAIRTKEGVEEFGGPEFNFLRGADTAVAGIVADSDQECGLRKSTIPNIQIFSVGMCASQALAEGVTQAVSILEAKQNIDAGSKVVFIYGSKPGISFYKSKPIIQLALAGRDGFSVGLVFGETIRIYLFPYQTKNGLLVRPRIEDRISECWKLLAPLKNVDGCEAELVAI